MVEENDSRLASVMREVVKNSDQYIEQMLIYDLLRRNHLETYLRNTLRQIEICLDKNVDKFIHTNEYKQAKGLFQEKETEFQSWTEKYGNQVRVKEENLKLYEKAAEEKRLKLKEEKDKEQEKNKEKPQNEWNQRTQSNGNKEEINTKRKRRKDKRGKKGKGRSTGGRPIVRKWVESNETNTINTTTSSISLSAWLTDDIGSKKKEKNNDKLKKKDKGVELTPKVRETLTEYNLNLEGKKEPFRNLPRHKKFILRPLPGDCFISNISFSFYDKDPPQGTSKPQPSSNYILENLDRLFTPEKQNLVFELGEELRPESLLPYSDDIPITTNDFLYPMSFDTSPDGMFTSLFTFKSALEDFFSLRSLPDEISTSSVLSFLKSFSKICSQEDVCWLLQRAQEDHVDIIVQFLVSLKENNISVLKDALENLCSINPIRLFSIHVLFKLEKHEIDVPSELMNRFVGSWFQYCNQNLQGEEKKHQQSRKKILAAFVENTIAYGSYDLGLLYKEVDEFCSQNASLKSVQRMKQAIDERQKSQNKRRK